MGGPCAPSVVNTQTTGEGDITVNVVSQGQQSSITVIRAVAIAGNVQLLAADGIHAQDEHSVIQGNRVELFTKRSGIGDADQFLQIDSGFIDAGFISGLNAAELEALQVKLGDSGLPQLLKHFLMIRQVLAPLMLREFLFVNWQVTLFWLIQLICNF